MKIKARDLIKGINIGDIIKNKSTGDIIKVTFINKSFVDGVLYNTPNKDQFDTGERQLGMTDIIKL